MGFRSQGHGLLAGYQSAMAHNLQRDALGVRRAASKTDPQKAAAEQRKQLESAIRQANEYLRNDTLDTRRLTLDYLGEQRAYWGSAWPEALSPERFSPQAQVASPAAAGAPPAPRAPAAGGGGLFAPRQQPRVQAPASGLFSPAADSGLTPRMLSGFGSAELQKKSAEAERALFSMGPGRAGQGDLLMFLATGGGKHDPQPGALQAAMSNPEHLAAVLEGHYANLVNQGVDPAVARSETDAVWSKAMDLTKNAGAETDREFQRLRLQFQANDQTRGYLSDIERAAASRYGGTIQDGNLNLATIAEGEKPLAIAFMQRAMSRVLNEGMDSMTAILATTEELANTRYTPAPLKSAIDPSAPQYMMPTASASGVAPRSNLEPAEGAEFPWDNLFPGASHSFDPVTNLYLIYTPNEQGQYVVTALDPGDVREFVGLARREGQATVMGGGDALKRFSSDARARGEAKLRERMGRR